MRIDVEWNEAIELVEARSAGSDGLRGLLLFRRPLGIGLCSSTGSSTGDEEGSEEGTQVCHECGGGIKSFVIPHGRSECRDLLLAITTKGNCHRTDTRTDGDGCLPTNRMAPCTSGIPWQFQGRMPLECEGQPRLAGPSCRRKICADLRTSASICVPHDTASSPLAEACMSSKRLNCQHPDTRTDEIDRSAPQARLHPPKAPILLGTSSGRDWA